MTMKWLQTQRDVSADEYASYDGWKPARTEDLRRDGARYVPPQPELAEGYTRTAARLVEGDGCVGAWDVTDRLTAEIEAEARAADLAANGERYALQNQYLALCDQLTGGTAHAKLGFAELQAIIVALQGTDPMRATVLALQLLTLDAALKRVGGLQWWDNCEWRDLA